MSNQYLAVKDMPKQYPFLKQAALRNLIFRNENNIKSCMIKIGGRLLINTQKFDGWLESQALKD